MGTVRAFRAAVRALCIALPVFIFACAGEIDPGDGDGDGDKPDDPGPDDLVGDPYEAAPRAEPLGDDAVALLGESIDGILAQGSVAGTSQSVIVLDLESGQTLYEKNPDQFLIPASNTKLFTSAAALGALGADHRFLTRGYATGPIEGGVLAGDLVVIANHDFTASTYFYGKPELPLTRFADALYEAGLRRIDGDLLLAGEMLYQGYNFGSYNAINARATAAVQLEAALGARGIETGVLGTMPSFEVPEGSSLVAEHGSAPLSVAFVPLNVVSHNEFADITLRHIGNELGGESSYAAGEQGILSYLESIGLDVAGISLKDGSGLSRQNRVSARAVAALLEKTITSREGMSYVRTLTIAGIRGTLGNRMTGAHTVGRFFGKTGTLNGVIATSGVLFHRHDSRRYLISALMNDVGSQASARAVQDQVVRAVAGDLRESTALTAPTFLAARNDRSNLVEFEWTAIPEADGYVLWLSRDGATWDKADARLVRGTTFRADGLDGLTYARVTAFSAATGESAPSDVVAVTARRVSSRILLVDGNDRYQNGPAIENPAALAHDFASAYGESLGELGIDTVANEVIEDGTFGAVELASYDAVIWMLGEESTADSALSRDEQEAIAAYLQGGGKLLISGSELGWDLVSEGDPDDAEFYREVLKSDYVADASGSYAAAPLSAAIEMARFDFYNPGVLNVAFADVLAPRSGSETLLTYEDGSTAAILYDGDYQLINVGFPIEAIDSADARADLLRHAIVTFGL